MNMLALVLCCGLGSPGCVHTTHEVALSPLSVESLERSDDGESPLRATFQAQSGVASGHVEWAATCERTVVESARTQTVVETRPSRAAGAAVAGSAGPFLGAAMLFAMDDALGDGICKAIPSEDRGDESCSPSDPKPAILGVMAAALVITGVTLLLVQPTKTPGPIAIAPPAPPRVLAEDVPCDTGVAAGLRIARYQAETRVAATSTYGAGNFELPLPPGLTGSLVLVLDAVPPNTQLLRQGDVLGRTEAR